MHSNSFTRKPRAQSCDHPAPTELVAHLGSGSGPYRMIAALAAAFSELYGVTPSVRVKSKNDGGEAIMYLYQRIGVDTVAGSCTPTYLTTPLKYRLPISHQQLTPLGCLVSDTYLLVVRSNYPATDAKELFRRKTRCAAAPLGGNTHIQATLLRQLAEADIEVRYHETTTQAAASVLAGTADWTTGVQSDFESELASGVLRVIATMDSNDRPSAPAPSLISQGMPLVFPLWRGLIGPGRLNADAVKTWETWIADAVTTHSWNSYRDASHLHTWLLSAADFKALLDEEAVRYARWAPLLRE